MMAGGNRSEHVSHQDDSKLKARIEDGKLRVAFLSAVTGALLGSGGVFGVVKWVDGRELIALKAQYEVATDKAKLVGEYHNRIAELEAELDKIQHNGQSDSHREQIIRDELASVDADLEFVLKEPTLPGWCRDKMLAAQQRMRNLR